MIENPLAQRLLAADFVSGDVVRVELSDDTLDFVKVVSIWFDRCLQTHSGVLDLFIMLLDEFS